MRCWAQPRNCAGMPVGSWCTCSLALWPPEHRGKSPCTQSQTRQLPASAGGTPVPSRWSTRPAGVVAVGPWGECHPGRASLPYWGARKGCCRAGSPPREKTHWGGNCAWEEARASRLQSGPQSGSGKWKEKKKGPRKREASLTTLLHPAFLSSSFIFPKWATSVLLLSKGFYQMGGKDLNEAQPSCLDENISLQHLKWLLTKTSSRRQRVRQIISTELPVDSPPFPIISLIIIKPAFFFSSVIHWTWSVLRLKRPQQCNEIISHFAGYNDCQCYSPAALNHFQQLLAERVEIRTADICLTDYRDN